MKRFVGLFSIIILLAVALTAYSDCHIRNRTGYQSYNHGHGYQSYSHRQYYYYQNGYYYPYHGGNYGQIYYYENGYYYPYKEKIVLVPKAIQVDVYRDHFYSIQGAAQQDLLVDAIVGRLLRMQGGAKDAGGTTRVAPSPGVGPTGKAVVDLGDTRAGAYQDPEMLKIVNNDCAKCHGPSSKFTKFVTSDGKLPDLPAGKIWHAFGLVNSGEMPKGAKSLPDESVKKFYDWAKNAREK